MAAAATRDPRPSTSAALVANGAVAAVFVLAAYLESFHLDLYLAGVQEDRTLEWATFWAFLGAAAIAGRAACRGRRRDKGVPWFLLGVGLFCFFVAMEEISWGQRLLGYRPPAYFLEHNFQQEFNFHNVTSTEFRKLALKAVILGYGVLLPLAGRAPVVGPLLARLGAVAPPVGLIPVFAATYWVYEAYPWKFSGEVVELALGLGFLFAVSWNGPGAVKLPGWLRPAALAGAAVMLGVATTGLSELWSRPDSERMQAAVIELEALRTDLVGAAGSSGGRVTSCGVHKRVYSWVEKYRRDELYKGSYAKLTAGGLPDERAEFFLDPWNSPYWIRHQCSRRRGRERIVLYSFGANRRRDSTEWEALGDDVTAVIYDSEAAADTP